MGSTGIGHTRWATHGRPTEPNAHPHADCSGSVVAVHNGIFENFAERKSALQASGHRFASETDTEVFAHEVEAGYEGDLFGAVRLAARQLTGAYAVVVSSTAEPGVIVAARSGPPLVLGLGSGENYVASDPVALVPWTRDVVFLEDGDVARVDASGVRIVDIEGRPQQRATHRILWDAVAAEKGGYRHFMAKEIHEQPIAVAETFAGKVSLETGELLIESPLLSAERVAAFDRVLLLACGTSWHAAQIGKFLIEGMARIPVEVDYSSEFRYRRPVVVGPHADDRRLAVGGDGRHRRRPLGSAPVGCSDRRDRERARQPDRADGRRGLRDARRPGDRRRLDEGVHDAARPSSFCWRRSCARRAGSERASSRPSAALSRTCRRRSARPWPWKRTSRSFRANTMRPATSSSSGAACTTRSPSRGRSS